MTVKVQRYAFFISAVDKCVCLTSRSVRFTPEEKVPGTHWTESWVDPRAGLDTTQDNNSCPCTKLNPKDLVTQPVT
jgi:hypothetical protein